MNRSCMFVPSHRKKLIDSALVSEADTLVFDFEDSVPEGSLKKEAQKLYKDFYHTAKEKYNIWVRVNDYNTEYFSSDLTTLSECPPDTILYPKIESRDDFENRIVAQISSGLCSKGAALIESAAGIANLQDIAKSKFISALVFGNEDYETDLQSRFSQDLADLYAVRLHIAINARANNLLAIDTVTINYKNKDYLEKQITSALKLGYDGKLCLSPNEVLTVNNRFSPSDQELTDARRILELNQLAKKKGSGVAYIESKFIGPPMVKKAKHILKASGNIEK